MSRLEDQQERDPNGVCSAQGKRLGMKDSLFDGGFPDGRATAGAPRFQRTPDTDWSLVSRRTPCLAISVELEDGWR